MRDEEAEREREAEERARRELEEAYAAERQAAYFMRIALADRYWLDGQVMESQSVLDSSPDALRRWDWSHLRRRCEAELLTIPGKPQSRTAIAFGPGDVVAVACTDGNGVASVELWDVATGDRHATLEVGEADIVELAFSSPPSALLGVVTADGAIRTWEIRESTGVLRSHIDAHLDKTRSFEFKSAAFRPDCTQAVLTGFGNAKLVDVQSGETLLALEPDRWHITSFSADGERFAIGRRSPNFVDDGRITETVIWDAGTRTELTRIQDRDVTAVSLSTTGNQLAVAGQEGIAVYDTSNGGAATSAPRTQRACRPAHVHPGRTATWLSGC